MGQTIQEINEIEQKNCIILSVLCLQILISELCVHAIDL